MKRLIVICIGIIITHGCKIFSLKNDPTGSKFYSRKEIDSVFKSTHAQSLPQDSCIIVTGPRDSFQVAVVPAVKLTDSAEQKLSVNGRGIDISEADSLRFLFYKGESLSCVKMITSEDQKQILF